MIYFLIILQQFIASGTHVVAKGLSFDVPPALTLLVRASIATVFYIIWILLKGKALPKIDKADYVRFIFLGLLNIPMNQFLFLEGLKYTTAPNMALAYALTPAFVLILAIMSYREKATKMKIIGVVVAILGAAVVLMERGFAFSEQSITGDLMALAASASWALYTLTGRGVSIKYGSVFTTGMSMGMGLILYIPMYLFIDIGFPIETISAVNWLQILYLGAVTSGVGYGIWYYALTKIEAGKLSVFNNLQPVLTTVMAVIFFGTQLSGFFFAGGLMIIGGVYITQKG